MIGAALRARFDTTQPALEHIEEYVRNLLLGYCAAHFGSAFLERRKMAGSLQEKLESGRFASWSEVDDLYGATLVVPTLSDETDAHAFIRAKLFVVEAKLRGALSKRPQEFVFESPRFKCQLRAPDGMDNEAVYRQLFEVQTRTAFEHAWSVTTHKLSYKAALVDWRAQRVAAQLKAAVEQLDNTILAYDDLVKRVVPSPDDRTEVQALIGSAILQWRDRGLVPSEVMPASVGRFSENVYGLLSDRFAARDRVTQVLEAVQSWLTSPGNAFPVSLSVFQLILGIAAENRLIPTRAKYTYYVTEECASLFPATANLVPLFAYAT